MPNGAVGASGPSYAGNVEVEYVVDFIALGRRLSSIVACLGGRGG